MENIPLKTIPGDFVSSYRGYDIYKEGESSFTIRYQGGSKDVVTRCGSAWSCVCYIDEMKSP